MGRILPVLVFGTVMLCAFGIAFADGPWLPKNISTIGEKIDHLWRMIFWLTVVIFFVTEGALLYFIFRYRERPGRRASFVHESNVAETIWSVVPGLILLFLAVYQWNTWAEAKLRPPDSREALRVEILAKQFEWRVRYAGPDGMFATADDVNLTNQLYIPKGKPILIQLRADDVIHSFFLPNMRVKQDIIPGQTVQVWFDANETGDYEIACSELCGLGHYRMRARLFIRSADEFETWLNGKYEATTAPSDWGWDWEEGV